MNPFTFAVPVIAAIFLLAACGEAPESDPAGSGSPSPEAVRDEGTRETLTAVGVEPPEAPERMDASPPSAATVNHADRFDLVSNLWVEMDGDYARLKFSIELRNITGDTVRPTFLEIEQQNWIAQGTEKQSVGGGRIGIRRPMELAPGERAFIHRGDFTTLGASELRRGAYAGAGFSGAVTLQSESGATFQVPFDYAVRFSIDESGNPLSQVWDDPPPGRVNTSPDR